MTFYAYDVSMTSFRTGFCNLRFICFADREMTFAPRLFPLRGHRRYDMIVTWKQRFNVSPACFIWI